MSDELAAQFARRFIQRRDVKSVQMALPDRVIYTPDREIKPERIGAHAPLGFTMTHLRRHLAGEATYGHYILDDQDMCRMFAFDLDLEPATFDKETGERISGWYSDLSVTTEEWTPIECDPRAEWSNRASPARPWLKAQMSTLAHKLIASVGKFTGYPCAAAYSGSKGIHVYGFTGPMPASQVRAAAHYVLESTDDWELFKGQHFFRHKLRDPIMGYPNFTLEVFPKQDSLDGKDLGNLMRLPLGRNLKSVDPCFFLDLKAPVGQLMPHPDPVTLLDSGDPYS